MILSKTPVGVVRVANEKSDGEVYVLAHRPPHHHSFSPIRPPSGVVQKKTATIKLLSRLVNPPGLEPGTPTLKVLCSTC